MSAAYGLKQWDVLPLEYLIARPPRVLLSVGAAETGSGSVDQPSRGRAIAADGSWSRPIRAG